MSEPYRYFALAGEDHDHDGIYPRTDPAGAADGDVLTFDEQSQIWLPKPAPSGDHDHAKLERIPDSETSQRTVHVSPDGSDSAGDGSNGSPWATIQHAIDQAQTIMQRRNSASAYRILCGTGVYEFDFLSTPAILLAGFFPRGEGGIWIRSATNNPADVVLRGTSTARAIQAFGDCTLQALTIENDRAAVEVKGSGSTTAIITGCVLQRQSLESGGHAAIACELGKAISINNTSTDGRLFANGLVATHGGVVAKVSSQPQGSSANEQVGPGGMIR